MKAEQQRIAIAEACGWTGPFIPQWLDLIGIDPNGDSDAVPDYLNDLNAMHEAEKVLTSNEHVNGYYRNLCDVVSPGGNMQIDGMLVICATAAQRAEAFLRTLGLWEGE